MKYTVVGTTHGAGFGAGVWTRRGILWGVDENAAECGHLKIFDKGSKCGCPNEGCAETLGSGTGVENNARTKIVMYRFESDVYKRAKELALKSVSLDEIKKNPFIPLNFVDAKLVFDVYNSNSKDRVAREVVEEAGNAIGRAYGAIACFYNPFFIATFGGLMSNWGLLEDRINDEMRRSCNVRVPDVFVTRLGEDVGLRGAIARAMGYGE